MIEILGLAGSIDLIERTSSTATVQHTVQLSLAPAFLLAAIGAVMNVMTNRLLWVADRIERITRLVEEGRAGASELADLLPLEMRRIYAQRAVMFSTAAALTISIVIVLLFVSAFVRTPLGTFVAAIWIATMTLLSIGLSYFLRETYTAARRNRERLREMEQDSLSAQHVSGTAARQGEAAGSSKE